MSRIYEDYYREITAADGTIQGVDKLCCLMVSIIDKCFWGTLRTQQRSQEACWVM